MTDEKTIKETVGEAALNKRGGQQEEWITVPRRAGPIYVPVNASKHFASRGFYANEMTGCFVCGGDKGDNEYGIYDTISGFVDSEEEGKEIVSMFSSGARLDLIPRLGPNWLQVKIGACEKHLVNLVHLDMLTSEGDNTITKEMIAKAAAGGKFGVVDNGGNSQDGILPSEHFHPFEDKVYDTEDDAREAAQERINYFKQFPDYDKLWNLRVYVVRPDGTRIMVTWE
ncbi:MAG: hypothetical protein QXR73_03305 [Candidatus Micrarchaeaceae archaeon]